MSRLLTCVALFILLEAYTMVTLAGHSNSCQEHCKETCWTNSFQKQKGFECCGGRPYNKASHVCCEDGRIIRGKPGMSCCGNHLFHPDLESCCEGTVIKGVELKCCRGSPYNKLSAICCEGKIHENYNEMDSQCCGSKPYYPRIQKCCNHEILPRTPGILCCGKNLYNRSLQICAPNKTIIHMHSPSSRLCGEHLYDSNKFDCVNLEIVNKTDNPTSNSNSLKEESQLNCSGQLYKANGAFNCCGEMIYEAAKHLCVNNTIYLRESYDKLGPHIVMCGSNTYFQPSHQTCCINSSHFGHVQNVTGGRCCAGKAYDPDDTFCCSGRMYTKENWQYIGEDSFLDDAGNFICCNQIEYKITAGEKACHGSIPYNPDNEIVCEDIVHQQKDGICCGKVLYNPLNEICCNGRRYPKSDGGLKPVCCGTKLYDSSDNTLRCCGIQLHKVKNGMNAHCCGNLLINNSQKCCTSESQQRPLTETNNLTCCGHLIYNTTEEKCHAGQLSHHRRQNNHSTFNTKERCRLVTLDNIYLSEEHKQGVFGKVISIEAKNGERRLILGDYAKLNVSKCPHQVSLTFFPQTTENVTIRDKECPSLTVGNTYVFWCPDPGRICEEISPVNFNGNIYISNFLRIGSGQC